MSKYNSYARKLDEIARGCRDNYRQAEKSLSNAKIAADRYNKPLASYTYEAQANALAAQSNLAAENDRFQKFKKQFGKEEERQIAKLRENLIREVVNDYSANPEHIDTNTLELLRSGILSAQEYSQLMDTATSNSNHTMVRIIAKYAGEVETDNKAERTILMNLKRRGIVEDGREYIVAFDSLTDAFHRCVAHPSLFNKWESLSENIVENY